MSVQDLISEAKTKVEDALDAVEDEGDKIGSEVKAALESALAHVTNAHGALQGPAPAEAETPSEPAGGVEETEPAADADTEVEKTHEEATEPEGEPGGEGA